MTEQGTNKRVHMLRPQSHKTALFPFFCLLLVSFDFFFFFFKILKVEAKVIGLRSF